ncbi:MAG: hypothetical protein KGN79_12240 [Acidobacteriota bacterium]|nr:hypothetical protein [Acidobacteriota bacterium]
MAHPDLNELLNALYSAAENLLTKNGEFYPIGAFMASDGAIQFVGVMDGDNEHPSSQSLIDSMTAIFQQSARQGALRAAGICYDALTIPPGKNRKQDAMCCSLEHSHGEAVEVFRPYTKTQNGQIQFDDIFATRRTPHFFCEPLLD